MGENLSQSVPVHKINDFQIQLRNENTMALYTKVSLVVVSIFTFGYYSYT